MNPDFTTLSQYRIDGRTNFEHRPITCAIGVDNSFDGSSTFSIGLTSVICSIEGPYPADDGGNLLKLDYSVAAFSGFDQRKHTKFDREWNHFAENVKECLEGLICGNYSKSQISINIVILQADGNTKAAIFNAITLALLDAGIALKDLMVAVNVGVVKESVLVDLNSEEEKSAFTELLITFMPRSSTIDFVDLKSKKSSSKEVSGLFEVGEKAAIEIYTVLSDYVKEFSLRRLLFSR